MIILIDIGIVKWLLKYLLIEDKKKQNLKSSVFGCRSITKR